MENRLKTLAFIILSVLVISCSSDPEIFPNEISGLQRGRKLSGEEAKQFVNKLHINTVTNEKNEIAFYESIRGRAIIYVTFYSYDLDANQNLIRMAKKISPQISVFSKGNFIELSGKRIYHTLGMGQEHFVFVQKKMLFWVSVDIGLAQKFMNSYLQFLL